MAERATASLLLVDFDGVAFLHLERRWGVIFIDRGAIEAEADDLHRQTLEEAEI